MGKEKLLLLLEVISSVRCYHSGIQKDFRDELPNPSSNSARICRIQNNEVIFGRFDRFNNKISKENHHFGTRQVLSIPMNGFDVDFYCPSIMSQVYFRIPFVYDDQERVNSKLKQSIFPENRHRLFHIHSQIMLVVWLVKVRDYFRCTFSDYHYNRQQISNYNNHLCSRVSRCCVYLSHVDLLIYKLVELCTCAKIYRMMQQIYTTRHA